MNIQVKPATAAIVLILLAVIVTSAGYFFTRPGSLPQSSAAITISANQAQQQQFSRLHLTAQQEANPNSLPPYVHNVQSQETYSKNIGQLSKLVNENPNQRTADQNDFVSHLPPYLARRAKWSLEEGHRPGGVAHP